MTDIPEDFEYIAKGFKSLGIPTSDIAFYNHPKFLEAEIQNPKLIELYAAFVRLRPRDDAYEEYARKIVPLVAQILAEEIQSDGQLGACVDAAQMLNKILEELGIWSYLVQGSMTISEPSLPCPTYFWLFDEKPIPGHVWVTAPPFDVIDITLKAQPYERHEADLLPIVVVSEGEMRIRPESTEFLEPSILASALSRVGGPIKTVHERAYPGMMSAVNFFPSWQLKKGKLILRYATGGISLSDAPNLTAIKNRKWNGRHAFAVLSDIIRPALDAADDKLV